MSHIIENLTHRNSLTAKNQHMCMAHNYTKQSKTRIQKCEPSLRFLSTCKCTNMCETSKRRANTCTKLKHAWRDTACWRVYKTTGIWFTFIRPQWDEKKIPLDGANMGPSLRAGWNLMSFPNKRTPVVAHDYFQVRGGRGSVCGVIQFYCSQLDGAASCTWIKLLWPLIALRTS